MFLSWFGLRFQGFKMSAVAMPVPPQFLQSFIDPKWMAIQLTGIDGSPQPKHGSPCVQRLSGLLLPVLSILEMCASI
jgi:hypothetical protein